MLIHSYNDLIPRNYDYINPLRSNRNARLWRGLDIVVFRYCGQLLGIRAMHLHRNRALRDSCRKSHCATDRGWTAVTYPNQADVSLFSNGYLFLIARDLFPFSGHLLRSCLFTIVVVAGISFPEVVIHFVVSRIGRYSRDSIQALGTIMYYSLPSFSLEHISLSQYECHLITAEMIEVNWL